MKSKEQKQEEAAERAVAYAALTTSEKLEQIIARPGLSRRERLRVIDAATKEVA